MKYNEKIIKRSCNYILIIFYIINIKVFYLPTDARENFFKKNIKIYIDCEKKTVKKKKK
jgi:hypothetical protein